MALTEAFDERTRSSARAKLVYDALLAIGKAGRTIEAAFDPEDTPEAFKRAHLTIDHDLVSSAIFSAERALEVVPIALAKPKRRPPERTDVILLEVPDEQPLALDLGPRHTVPRLSDEVKAQRAMEREVEVERQREVAVLTAIVQDDDASPEDRRLARERLRSEFGKTSERLDAQVRIAELKTPGRGPS